MQTTICRPAAYTGNGFLTGTRSTIHLLPAPPDTGIVFNHQLPAVISRAALRDHFVTLGQGRNRILAVEHLLAACYGLGIDNLLIQVNGCEIPFGDGSARLFSRLLWTAGIRRCPAPRRQQQAQPVFIHSGAAFIAALPAERLRISYCIRFPDLTQAFTFRLNPARFYSAIAPARTFAVGAVRHSGQAVRTIGSLSLPARRRFPDEPVRHKILDLLGDLCLLGRRLQADIFACRAGHKLHHQLVTELEKQWTSMKSGN